MNILIANLFTASFWSNFEPKKLQLWCWHRFFTAFFSPPLPLEWNQKLPGNSYTKRLKDIFEGYFTTIDLLKTNKNAQHLWDVFLWKRLLNLWKKLLSGTRQLHEISCSFSIFHLLSLLQMLLGSFEHHQISNGKKPGKLMSLENPMILHSTSKGFHDKLSPRWGCIEIHRNISLECQNLIKQLASSTWSF